MQRRLRLVRVWPAGAFGLVSLSVLMFALPDRLEGVSRVYIGPGHALSTLDTLALLPLVGGVGWLYGGFWRRRRPLAELLYARPGRAGLLLFTAGLGVGLLLASSFSGFFWWWAVGAVLHSAVIITAALLLTRRSR